MLEVLTILVFAPPIVGVAALIYICHQPDLEDEPWNG